MKTVCKFFALWFIITILLAAPELTKLALASDGVIKKSNKFVKGNNTYLIIKTRTNSLLEFPLHEVHVYRVSGRNGFINVETEESDLFINIDQVEWYKLVDK